MASSIVYGKIGSGKTYYLVRYILQHYRDYDYVVTNFPVSIPKVRNLYAWTDKEIGARWVESGLDNTLFVLDEAWALWNSRNFKDFDYAVQEWFALSRHYGNHIIIATQSIARIDKVIRELSSDFIFIHSWRLWFMKEPRPVLIHAEHYDTIVENDGMAGVVSPKNRQPTRTEHFLFRKSIARYYDTHLLPPKKIKADGDKEVFDIRQMPRWGR